MICGTSYELLREYNSKIQELNADPSRADYDKKAESLREELRQSLLRAIGEYNQPTDCPVYSRVFGKEAKK